MKDGGPAFPVGQMMRDGLSKRDVFALGAMIGFYASQANSDIGIAAESYDHVARSAYKLADAMLAERERGQQ